MRVRLILEALAAIFLCIPLCHANISASAGTSDDLIRWTRETGKASILRSRVAALLGVGNCDVAVAEHAFRFGPEIHLIGAAAETDRGTDAFLFIIRISDVDNTAMVWLGSATGHLRRALFIDPSEGMTTLQVDEQLGEFLAEKEFFRRKMHESANR